MNLNDLLMDKDIPFPKLPFPQIQSLHKFLLGTLRPISEQSLVIFCKNQNLVI